MAYIGCMYSCMHGLTAALHSPAKIIFLGCLLHVHAITNLNMQWGFVGIIIYVNTVLKMGAR